MTANAMLIRSKIKRPGGTTVTMADGSNIKFAPDENGDHVAMVSNRDHIGRLLSITEGFEIHFADTPVATATTALSAPQAPAITPAPQAPANAAPPANSGDLSALSDDQLRDVFQAELGRAPHPKAKRETIVAQIEAYREETK